MAKTRKSALPVAAKESTVSDPFIERADSFAEFYVNHCQVGFTPYDVFIFLSEAAHGSDGNVHLRQKTRVVMSPIEAKLLIKFLTNAMVTFESTYGEVKIHPSIDVDVAG